MKKSIKADQILDMINEARRVSVGLSDLQIKQTDFKKYSTTIGDFNFSIELEENSFDKKVLLNTMISNGCKSMFLDELPHVAKSVIGDDKGAYEVLQILYTIINEIDSFRTPETWKTNLSFKNIKVTV